MKTPPPVKVPFPPSPPSTPTKQQQFNKNILEKITDLNKILLLMFQKSAGPDQEQSTDELYQHLQLTKQEQEEQRRLDQQEQELQLEQQRQQQEQLRREQEEAERLRHQQEQEKQDKLAQNRSQQAKLREEERLLCAELQMVNPPYSAELHWPEVHEYLSWAAPALVEYFQTGQSTMLNPDLIALLAPHMTTHASQGVEEGELTNSTKKLAILTDLTKAKIPTVMIGTHSPKQKQSKDKVARLEADTVCEMVKRDMKRSRDFSPSQRKEKGEDHEPSR